MSSNYILIRSDLSIKEAMRALIEQAGKNDNISTIFVKDGSGVFCGAIDLNDLIRAREGTPLSALITASFPYVYAEEPLEECLGRLKGYSESCVPVLDNGNRLVGVVTAQNVLQALDETMGEDYARLAGLSAEEDLREPLRLSIRKRLPWLMILLGLGMLVSSVLGLFEPVMARLSVLMSFQSLILDMAGNVGTQSLAVTIRVLGSGGLSLRQKLRLFGKELRVGLWNGCILGLLSTLALGIFIALTRDFTPLRAFAVSGCIGLSLLLAILSSSASGTLIPLFFQKIHVDPAVASGPLITTVNDLAAAVCYYGLSWLFLIRLLHW